jgi:hypothetical protein
LIPGSISRAIPNGVVLAKFRIFGTTLGNREIESNEHTFQIQVCRGCLVDYPAVVGTPGRLDCVAGTDADTEVNGCLYGQDGRVPCTSCATTVQGCQNACMNCAVRPGLSDAQCAMSEDPDCP